MRRAQERFRPATTLMSLSPTQMQRWRVPMAQRDTVECYESFRLTMLVLRLQECVCSIKQAVLR